ncbi:hypothetical protein K9O30_00315 [Clostridium bowmanii]|uniref:hypothetical protein n=1 Tax=Clostridium bowmanii TaxID=132925 RepID=UPI001CD71D6D|nr:hypothetical protein [Clostridium bowmanii]MCA1072215.1 hypothetical protein [Clostridium bowmanii]
MLRNIKKETSRTNPNAKTIYNVKKITYEIKRSAKGAGSKLGTGGMATKIKVAEIVVSANASMIVGEIIKLENRKLLKV